jgi:hypothetical protein
MSLEIRPLRPDDVSAIHALYAAEFASLPKGTLNPLSLDELTAILSPGAGAGAGAFDGARLVGYALCEVCPWESAPEPFALNRSLTPGEPVGKVRGTLIDRACRGHRLGPRLLCARRAALAELGVRHAVGMMLPDNLGSIVIYLRTGGLLCGIAYDDYDLVNFAHYSGDLADRAPGREVTTAMEVDEMRALFARGYVCRSLRWEAAAEGKRPAFEMTGEFAV